MYGSEIWGLENIDIILGKRFCKLILHLEQSTPNFMVHVYGELGRYPISVIMKVRMIIFWCRILNGKEFKLSYLLYKLMYIHLTNYG